MSSTPVIIGGSRIPFTKSFTHYSKLSTQDLGTFVLQSLVDKYSLQDKEIGEVAMGAVIKNSSDWNLARECILGTNLKATTPGYDLQRACGTSLEAVIQLANKIRVGQIETGIAAGVDTNSDAPIVLSRNFAKKLIGLSNSKDIASKLKTLTQFRPSDLIPIAPAVVEPRTKLSMGQHCELMVKEWKIPREEQDQIAFESHQKATQAYEEGFYDDQVFEYQGISKDTLVRPGTTMEKLKTLRPVFDHSGEGTLTAGNSTALTDGAAAVFLASEEYANKHNLPILARFVDGQSAALDYVHGAGLLMAPTLAVSRMLQRQALKLQDFSHYEIHEAFAGQLLCTLKAWEDPKYCQEVLSQEAPLGSIDRSKMNVKGGSVAIGHPFAATGARIVSSLAKILSQAESGRGLISVCTAGGMGVAAILDR